MCSSWTHSGLKCIYCLYCLVARAMRAFGFRFITSGTPNKWQVVEKRSCSHRNSCFWHDLYVCHRRLWGVSGTLPSLWRSTTFSRVPDSTSPVDCTASHHRSRNFGTVFFMSHVTSKRPGMQRQLNSEIKITGGRSNAASLTITVR